MVIYSKVTKIENRGLFLIYAGSAFSGGVTLAFILFAVAFQSMPRVAALLSATVISAHSNKPETHPTAPVKNETCEEFDETQSHKPSGRPPVREAIPTPTPPNRNEPFVSPQPELLDTAAKLANVTIPVTLNEPNLAKPHEMDTFGESTCETPKSCPHRRTRGSWYCSSENSSIRVSTLPAAQYTQEAERFHIHGEVRLTVVFGGNGEIRVKQVLQSLGHGLDESAMAAATKIQYQPALKEGCPVDAEHTVTVKFGEI